MNEKFKNLLLQNAWWINKIPFMNRMHGIYGKLNKLDCNHSILINCSFDFKGKNNLVYIKRGGVEKLPILNIRK